MKIREILLENEEHIKTYWAIMGIDIDSYYRAFDDITKDTNIIRRKSNILQLSSYVHSILIDGSWENLESDPDFNRVYDELLDLYDKIQDIYENK